MVHIKCRGGLYPFSQISRLAITDNQVPWNIPWPNYNPPNHTSDKIKNASWADPDVSDSKFKPKWNQLDGNVNRQSHIGQYNVFKGVPLNPEGRTGIKGRGVLGRWGPNHAADPIVSRWKLINGEKQINSETKLYATESLFCIVINSNFRPVLEICVIQRKDNNEWAIPGGMVDPGETISQTLRREFMEETLDSSND